MAIIRYREVHYTPGDDVRSLLGDLPNRVETSLDVEIYGLTDMSFVGAVKAAIARGVKVRVLHDRSQSTGPADHAATQALVDAGATVIICESEKGAIDHLKQIIGDGEDGALADTSWVAYGSYNFSAGAQNQDNVFVVTNDPGEVAKAQEKFEYDWLHNKRQPEWQIAKSGGI